VLEQTAELDALLRRSAAAASSSGAALEERAAAARLLGLDPTGSSRDRLLELVVPREPEGVQLAAAQALVGLRDARVFPALVERWKSSTGRVREAILAGFFARREHLPDLVAALEKGMIEPSSLSRARKTQIVRALRDEGRSASPKLAAALSDESRKGVIDRYRSALRLDSSPERGAAVFQKSCSRCHRAGDSGFEVGPDLAGLASRTREDLLVQILDPNAYVVPGYEEYAVDTTDGRVTSGVVARETATSVTLRRGGGEEETVLRAQVARMRSLSVSQMPEDLEKGITPQEMADLLAFVKGLGARRAASQIPR
jgi:putative heme-binding domain-containing protein